MGAMTKWPVHKHIEQQDVTEIQNKLLCMGVFFGFF